MAKAQFNSEPVENLGREQIKADGRDYLAAELPTIEDRLQSIANLAFAAHMASEYCTDFSGPGVVAALKSIIGEISEHAKAAQLALYTARDHANLAAPVAYRREVANG